jgi:hypothetical protein
MERKGKEGKGRERTTHVLRSYDLIWFASTHNLPLPLRLCPKTCPTTHAPAAAIQKAPKSSKSATMTPYSPRSIGIMGHFGPAEYDHGRHRRKVEEVGV